MSDVNTKLLPKKHQHRSLKEAECRVFGVRGLLKICWFLTDLWKYLRILSFCLRSEYPFMLMLFIRTQALEEGTSLEMLPERLRTEIAIHVHLDTLRKVCFSMWLLIFSSNSYLHSMQPIKTEASDEVSNNVNRW